MKKPIKSSRWILSFFALILVLAVCFGALSFAIDPFLQFRIRDNAYMLSGWFVSPGLIQNHDYDTLILGSSMAQNFRMDTFRETLGIKPLKIALGGIRFREISELTALAYEAEKANTFYISADLSQFTNDTKESRNFQYLMRHDVLSRLRYLFSYEVWFRYVPTDAALLAADFVGVSLPEKFRRARSIDWLEDWSLDAAFGEDVVINNYKIGSFQVSDVDTDDLLSRMYANIVEYLDAFQYDKGAHVFFFPPYSSLCWTYAQDHDYFEEYLQAKEYFIEKASALGAIVYDFQSADFTMDLNNYRDTTHYSPEINDWMVSCFASGDYRVTEENVDALQQKLVDNTNAFRAANPELMGIQKE